MRIHELMTRHVFCCAPDDSLSQAAHVMWEKRCGCLPVIDEVGRVVGMITDRDICMAAYTRGTPLSLESVASSMAKRVIGCGPEDDVSDAELLMKTQQIRRVPVLDAQGHLQGLITLGDLARQEAHFDKPDSRSAAGAAATLTGICERRGRRAVGE